MFPATLTLSRNLALCSNPSDHLKFRSLLLIPQPRIAKIALKENRLKISIIGAGRVGQTLGHLARKRGHRIGEVVCRSQKSARAAVKFIGAGTAQSVSRAQLSPADVIMISTPDDAVEEAVKLIAEQNANIKGTSVFHTSGAKSSSVLDALSQTGMSAASCHPLQTFQSAARAVTLISKTWFCIEGEPRATRAARRLVRDIGARYFEIDTAMKSLYHAAAVMASGGVTALLSISLEMLERTGLSKSQAKKALLPLTEATVANVRDVGPALALTGPVRRGDMGTVDLNMKATGDLDSQWLEIYRLLALRSLALANQAGADEQAIARLHSLLKKR